MVRAEEQAQRIGPWRHWRGTRQAVRADMVEADALGEEKKRCARPGEALPQVRVLIDGQLFVEQPYLLQQLTSVSDSHRHSDVLLHQQMGNLLGRPGADLAEVRVGGAFFEQVVGEEKDVGLAVVLGNELQIFGIIFVIMIQIGDPFAACFAQGFVPGGADPSPDLAAQETKTRVVAGQVTHEVTGLVGGTIIDQEKLPGRKRLAPD